MISNTQVQLGINMTHENKTWVIKKVSVQIKCEYHNHENFSLSSIIPQNKKIIKTYLIFKVYVCPIQTKVYIHIQNITSPQNICIKARGSKRMYMYNNNLDKIDIYMKLNK